MVGVESIDDRSEESRPQGGGPAYPAVSADRETRAQEDRRLLVRFPTGELVSLWWGSLVGFDAHLGDAYVVLDFGDGRPRLVAGADVSTVAVAGIAHLYGVQALTRHEALTRVRQPATE